MFPMPVYNATHSTSNAFEQLVHSKAFEALQVQAVLHHLSLQQFLGVQPTPVNLAALVQEAGSKEGS